MIQPSQEDKDATEADHGDKMDKQKMVDNLIASSVDNVLKLAGVPMDKIIKLVAAEANDHPDPECVKGQGLIEKMAFTLVRQIELVGLARMKNKMIEKVLMKALAEKMTNFVGLSQRDRGQLQKKAMMKVEELEREFKQVEAEKETAEAAHRSPEEIAELKAREERIFAKMKEVRDETKKQADAINDKIA